MKSNTFVWPTPLTAEIKSKVRCLDLRGNRLRGKSACCVADMLMLNKTVTSLNLSCNMIDSEVCRPRVPSPLFTAELLTNGTGKLAEAYLARSSVAKMFQSSIREDWAKLAVAR